MSTNFTKVAHVACRSFSTESKLLLQNILCDQSAALKLCSYSLMIGVHTVLKMVICKNTVILCLSSLAVFYSNLNHEEENVTEISVCFQTQCQHIKQAEH